MMSNSQKASFADLFERSKQTQRSSFGKLSLILLWLSILPLTRSISKGGLFNGSDQNQCPVECGCLGNVVDCSGLQLIGAPSGLPPWTEIL